MAQENQNNETVATVGERVVAQGRLITFERAKKDLLSVEVSRSSLGWTVRYVDSDFSTLLSPQQAAVLLAMFVIQDHTEEQAEAERLTEERGE